jgi:hypothetical protein
MTRTIEYAENISQKAFSPRTLSAAPTFDIGQRSSPLSCLAGKYFRPLECLVTKVSTAFRIGVQRKSRSRSAWVHQSTTMLRPRLPRLAFSLRRSIHRVPPLEHFRNGIPGLLTPDGFQLAYTDYQSLMLEKLNALTAGMFSCALRLISAACQLMSPCASKILLDALIYYV